MGPNVQVGGQIVQANIVISAFTTELFLKCIVCIETALTPRGHHLFELFGQLRPETQAKIIHLWDTQIIPKRDPEWKMIEKSQFSIRPFKRDLPGALSASSYAFEKIRYSYEPGSKEGDFNVGDLPRVLHLVILEMKPEWAKPWSGHKGSTRVSPW